MEPTSPRPKALVTGGAGFIGSHLCETLLNDGWEVYALDDLSTGSLDNVAHLRERWDFHLVVDSVLSPTVVNELVYKCDVVYHLAAAVGVRLIVEQPVRTLLTNVRGTEVVLEHAHRFGKRLLLASTSEVYGDHRDRTPLPEDARRVYGPTTTRRWAYADSKAMDELLALAYHQERGLDVVIARLFNTVGPCIAYFGEKDAQQLAVIRGMVRDLSLPVDVRVCPVVREPDGLALSSRNRLLSPDEREAATCLFLALSEAASLARATTAVA